MTAIDAARAAGWVYWGFDIWTSTDLESIFNLFHPLKYTGTARDVCLAHGICFTEPPIARQHLCGHPSAVGFAT